VRQVAPARAAGTASLRTQPLAVPQPCQSRAAWARRPQQLCQCPGGAGAAAAHPVAGGRLDGGRAARRAVRLGRHGAVHHRHAHARLLPHRAVLRARRGPCARAGGPVQWRASPCRRPGSVPPLQGGPALAWVAPACAARGCDLPGASRQAAAGPGRHPAGPRRARSPARSAGPTASAEVARRTQPASSGRQAPAGRARRRRRRPAGTRRPRGSGPRRPRPRPRRRWHSAPRVSAARSGRGPCAAPQQRARRALPPRFAGAARGQACSGGAPAGLAGIVAQERLRRRLQRHLLLDGLRRERLLSACAARDTCCLRAGGCAPQPRLVPSPCRAAPAAAPCRVSADTSGASGEAAWARLARAPLQAPAGTPATVAGPRESLRWAPESTRAAGAGPPLCSSAAGSAGPAPEPSLPGTCKVGRLAAYLLSPAHRAGLRNRCEGPST